MTTTDQLINRTTRCTNPGGLSRRELRHNPLLFVDFSAKLGTSSWGFVVRLLENHAWYESFSSSGWSCLTTDQGISTLAESESQPQGGSVQEAIAELRRLSGLNWDQLARLLGVSRRSVHFWASGQVVRRKHQERVHRLLAVLRRIDRGSALENRALLLTAGVDGVLPFDLLAEGRFEEAAGLLKQGPGRRRPVLTPLSPEERLARTPPAPGELVDALNDRPHVGVSGARPVRAHRVRK